MQKRLTRSRDNRVIAGVMGGIGEYYDTDPVLFRLLYLLLTVFTGVVPGIIGYILAMMVVPEAISPRVTVEPLEKRGDDAEKV